MTRKRPSADSRQTGIGHPHIDARSFEMARLVIERIDADPGLFNVGQDNLEREQQLRGRLSPTSTTQVVFRLISPDIGGILTGKYLFFC